MYYLLSYSSSAAFWKQKKTEKEAIILQKIATLIHFFFIERYCTYVALQ
jgi:hypothetical protein